jgi:hypothetical protein
MAYFGLTENKTLKEVRDWGGSRFRKQPCRQKEELGVGSPVIFSQHQGAELGGGGDEEQRWWEADNMGSGGHCRNPDFYHKCAGGLEGSEQQRTWVDVGFKAGLTTGLGWEDSGFRWLEVGKIHQKSSVLIQVGLMEAGTHVLEGEWGEGMGLDSFWDGIPFPDPHSFPPSQPLCNSCRKQSRWRGSHNQCPIPMLRLAHVSAHQFVRERCLWMPAVSPLMAWKQLH